MRARRLLLKLALALAAALTVYYTAEGVYRHGRYRELMATDIRLNDWAECPPCMFHNTLGFRYYPNSVWPLPRHPPIRINNHSHVSPRVDTFEQSQGEYRIGVLADSFGTCWRRAQAWPITLEDLLNADEALKAQLGVRTFKVINGAMDGTGILQWPSVLEHDLSRYSPDLIVASFITHDIDRRFSWRATIPCEVNGLAYQLGICTWSLPADLSNPDGDFQVVAAEPKNRSEAETIIRHVRRLRVRRVPWFSLYPELFAKRLGHRFGMRPRLFRDDTVRPPERAAQLCLAALHQLNAAHPHVLFARNPIGIEICPPDPAETELWDEAEFGRMLWRTFCLAREQSGNDLEIIEMLDYLPRSRGIQEVATWFDFGQIDGHFSDKGAALYAEAVHRMLKERLVRPTNVDQRGGRGNRQQATVNTQHSMGSPAPSVSPD